MSAADVTDEISLVDVARIFSRRRYSVLIGLFTGLVFGLGWLLWAPTLYEVGVTIRIGQVAGAGLFEPPEVLSSRLLVAYGEEMATGVRRERPFLKRALVPRGVTGIVELIVEGDTPGEASAFMERVVRDVLVSHGRNYEDNIGLLKQRVEQIDAQRAALQQRYEAAAAVWERLRQSEPAQASVVLIEQARIASLVMELDAEKPTIAQKLTAPQSQPTEMLGQLTVPTVPSSPNRLVVMTIAVVAGLAIGVVWAFLLELRSTAAIR